MQFQYDVASSSMTPPAAPQQPAETVPELLRQILEAQRQTLEMQREYLAQMVEVQREHLNHVRAVAQDALARWKNLLSRWQKEQPEFAEHCKQAYPILERAYVTLLVNMAEEQAQQGDEALDTDFSLQEFLDRYGMKLGQMSHLLSILGPLAEAAGQAEAK